MIYIFFGIIIVIFGIDLITKFVLSSVGFVKIIPDVFSFTYTENTGVAWSIGAGSDLTRWLVSAFAAAVIIAGIIIFVRFKGKTKLLSVASGLFIAGTLGNLFDRLVFGYVRDFIYLEFINFPIFNVADMGITFSCMLFAVYLIFFNEKAADK
jgi:signal peptidase II